MISLNPWFWCSLRLPNRVAGVLSILLPPVAIFDQIQFSTHYKQWIVGTPRNVTYLSLVRYDINPRVLDMFKISVANCPPRIHRQAGWQRLKSNCVGFQFWDTENLRSLQFRHDRTGSGFQCAFWWLLHVSWPWRILKPWVKSVGTENGLVYYTDHPSTCWHLLATSHHIDRIVHIVHDALVAIYLSTEDVVLNFGFYPHLNGWNARDSQSVLHWLPDGCQPNQLCWWIWMNLGGCPKNSDKLRLLSLLTLATPHYPHSQTGGLAKCWVQI